MCNPMMAAAGAMMAGSVLANSMGANAQAGARAGVMNRANQDQQQYQQQATDKFNATLPLASRENADKNAASAADLRSSRDKALIDSISMAPPVAGISAPADIGALFDSTMRDSGQRGIIQSNANAKVGGVADANQKLGIDLNKAGEWQRIFANNMVHNAALIPGELENANYAGSTERGIGSLLGAGGQAMGMAGMSAAPGSTGSSWGSLFSTGAPLTDGSYGPSQPGLFAKMFSGGK